MSVGKTVSSIKNYRTVSVFGPVLINFCWGSSKVRGLRTEVPQWVLHGRSPGRGLGSPLEAEAFSRLRNSFVYNLQLIKIIF